MIIDILGYLAGALCAITYIPQMHKLIKNKKSDDISLEFLYIGILSSVLWVLYGIFLMSWVIILTDCVILIVQTFLLYFTKKYRIQKPDSEDVDKPDTE